MMHADDEGGKKKIIPEQFLHKCSAVAVVQCLTDYPVFIAYNQDLGTHFHKGISSEAF